MIQKFLLALSFFTRLPIGRRDFGNVTLAQSAWAFPIVGAVIGALDGLFYLAMLNLGIASNIAAWLTIIFHLLLTGGLHEDGLADTADGLASGKTIEQKLAIMRDSRIGSYGVLTLVTVISLRANIISGFADNLPTLLLFVAAAAASRGFMVIFMQSTTYARNDGLAANSGKPSIANTLTAALISIISLLLTSQIYSALIAIYTLAVLYIIIRYVVIKNFGGITGDTLGASQQLSEVAMLIVFCITQPHY